MLHCGTVLEELRRAAREAKQRHPEIASVYLFGPLTTGGDGDADFLVVVRREFTGLFERCPYHIHTPTLPADTLVYSESEFARMAADPTSFLAGVLRAAVEL